MGKSCWMASLDQVLQRAYQIQHLCGLGRRWVEGLGLKVCHVGCLGLSPLSRWPLVRLRDVMNPTEDVEKDSLSIKRGENQMKQLLAVTQFQSECRWINLLIDSNRGPPWPRINYNRSPLPDCSRYANPCAILGRNKRASAVKCVLLLKSIVVGISGALNTSSGWRAAIHGHFLRSATETTVLYLAHSIPSLDGWLRHSRDSTKLVILVWPFVWPQQRTQIGERST